MLHALIPYITTPEYTFRDLPFVGDKTLTIFGTLVAIGVLLGAKRCLAFAKVKDIDETVAVDLMWWTTITGFIVAHWVSVLFYFPHQVQENPLILLWIPSGLSSVGGMFGALLGMRFFLFRRKQPVLVYADMLMFGFLLGWCFGRLGCTLVHDHPGRIVPPDTFFAVGPWGCPCPEGGPLKSACCAPSQEIWRYDLGLIEWVITIVLTSFVYFIYPWRTARPGQLTGLCTMVYAPTRFVLDFLREDTRSIGVSTPDLRYANLTTAQYFCIFFFFIGVYLLFFRKPNDGDMGYAKDSERLAREREEKSDASELDDKATSTEANHDDVAEQTDNAPADADDNSASDSRPPAQPG
ncbi:MAG: hypothetical protein B7733_17265 [Myxococcales bacterium FL481]|nr:MAG: hypothetical protein B7733_17265 [Myxococcales bacterium FL481]